MFDSSGEYIWISDPNHALYGKKLQLIETSSPRGKDQVIVVLENGQHRSIPKTSVSFEERPEKSKQVCKQQSVLISVRKLLPLVALVAVKLKALREAQHGLKAEKENPEGTQSLPTTRSSTTTAIDSVPSETIKQMQGFKTESPS